MPFQLSGFRPAASTTGTAPRIHTYRTTDAHAAVDNAGYFNEVHSVLEIGDLIYVLVVTGGGALSTAGWHVVATKTATTVDVTNVTALTVTNSD
ncbi:hypothetical protein [Rubritepida flocculans]|uniref:hypothetical protein n=1 Tax=Rubritepida flocculans TaxID=182403 RepID=UPI00042306E4|nr:hypothetical protein [Rubritepida flocculans]